MPRLSFSCDDAETFRFQRRLRYFYFRRRCRYFYFRRRCRYFFHFGDDKTYLGISRITCLFIFTRNLRVPHYRQKEMLPPPMIQSGSSLRYFLKYYLKQRARRKTETEASRGNRAEMGFVELGKRDKKCALAVQRIGRISV
jgi:hypothetical protein